MAKEMLINVSEGEECRIALVEKGLLEELYMERTSSTSHVNNIYKGRVTNVEASIQAAFIDFGLGRNGFLHVQDLMPTYFGRKGEDVRETVGHKLGRRDRPPIQKCLRRGDEVVVQIIKEGIGTKGPTLNTYLSIAGRYLVMMPGMAKNGVSRKIEDDEERRRLRDILDGLKPPTDCGFIVRTAGVGKTKAEISRDLTYLARLWVNIKKKRDSGPAPMELYTEGDLVTRTVRDVFTTDVDRIVVDNKEVARRVREFFKIAMPRTKNKVDLYEEPVPLFHKYGIEREIEQMYSRHVPLPSGGSLVIDSTEAIVAIDVNSGKMREHADAETTAFKTDMEAADEIARQLRLRDLGGVIICDFIDLRYERHRRELEKRLLENLREDRAKTKMLHMSQFGIIEMTRERKRPSLKRSIYFDCPHCKGAGLVKTPESMGLDVMRRLAIAINDQRVQRIDLAVCPEVAFVLQNKKRQILAGLESKYDKRVQIHSDVKLGMDEMRLELFDTRDGLIFLEELGMAPQSPVVQQGQRPHHPPHQGRQRGDPRRGRDRGRRGGRDQRPQLPSQAAYGESAEVEEREEMAEALELERAEDAVDDPTEAPAEVEETPEMGEAPVNFEGAATDPLTEVPEYSDADVEQMPEPATAAEPMAAPSEGSYRGGQEGEGGGRRRRRRRRGRGGRGRGGENQGGPQPEQPQPQPQRPAGSEGQLVDDDEINGNVRHLNTGGEPGADEERLEQEQQKKSRRRGSRGGRGRNRNRGGGQYPKPPPSSGSQHRQPPPPVVKTGSTDRHLVQDEPVMPQPMQRPRTYRDLDQIPDDLD